MMDGFLVMRFAHQSLYVDMLGERHGERVHAFEAERARTRDE
jgi:hypothetical protein